MICWFSKCDFWIPGKICDRHRWKIQFFEKNSRPKNFAKFYKGFPGFPYRNFPYRISIEYVETFFQKIWKKVRKKFSREFFDLEKKMSNFIFHLCRSQISPGIQKSHLENQQIIPPDPWRSKREIRLVLTSFWVALHMGRVSSSTHGVCQDAIQ